MRSLLGVQSHFMALAISHVRGDSKARDLSHRSSNPVHPCCRETNTIVSAGRPKRGVTYARRAPRSLKTASPDDPQTLAAKTVSFINCKGGVGSRRPAIARILWLKPRASSFPSLTASQNAIAPLSQGMDTLA